MEATLTIDMERKEFIEKYGDVEVTFSHYYKYTFTYATELQDGSKLSVGFGGHHDDIYHAEVSNNDKQLVRNLDPYIGSVYKDGGKVCSFYDY